MEQFKYWLISKVISKVLQKKCPRSIPLSGSETEKLNCFYIYVSFGEKLSKELVVLSINQDQLSGLWYDAHGVSHEESVSISSLDLSRISVTHYYHGNTAEYKGLIRYLAYELTKCFILYATICDIKDRISQYLFNKTKIEMFDRIPLLRKLVECYTEYGEGGMNIIDIMCEVYTERWLLLPTADALREKANLHLQLFVKSGDVKETDNGNFVITGQAILTLDQYQQEERRYQNDVRRQRWLIWLTVLLALSAMAQTKIIVFPELLNIPKLWCKLKTLLMK